MDSTRFRLAADGLVELLRKSGQGFGPLHAQSAEPVRGKDLLTVDLGNDREGDRIFSIEGGPPLSVAVALRLADADPGFTSKVLKTLINSGGKVDKRACGMQVALLTSALKTDPTQVPSGLLPQANIALAQLALLKSRETARNLEEICGLGNITARTSNPGRRLEELLAAAALGALEPSRASGLIEEQVFGAKGITGLSPEEEKALRSLTPSKDKDLRALRAMALALGRDGIAESLQRLVHEKQKAPKDSGA